MIYITNPNIMNDDILFGNDQWEPCHKDDGFRRVIRTLKTKISYFCSTTVNHDKIIWQNITSPTMTKYFWRLYLYNPKYNKYLQTEYCRFQTIQRKPK